MILIMRYARKVKLAFIVSINRIPLRGQTLDFVPAPFSKKNALHYA